jgi:hypothetical protein
MLNLIQILLEKSYNCSRNNSKNKVCFRKYFSLSLQTGRIALKIYYSISCKLHLKR